MRGRAICLVVVVALSGCGDEDSKHGPTSSTTTYTSTDASSPIPRANAAAVAPHPRFYFYFDGEKPARSAARELRSFGYAVRTTAPGGGIAEWSVIATGEPQSPDIATAEDAFEPWALGRDGEYDGNEVPVNSGHPELPVLAP
jgi:hypothetical protein